MIQALGMPDTSKEKLISIETVQNSPQLMEKEVKQIYIGISDKAMKVGPKILNSPINSPQQLKLQRVHNCSGRCFTE